MEGFFLPFKQKPGLSRYPMRVTGDPYLLNEVKSLVESNTLQELSVKEVFAEPGIYNRAFTVPKKDSAKRRMIFDQRPLNKCIDAGKFKIEILREAMALLEPGDWQTSVDLTEAHLPINPNSRKYLRLAIVDGHQTRVFQYKALPMGLNVSPSLSIKLMKVSLANIRKCGVRIIAYIDHLLIMARSQRERERESMLLTVWVLLELVKAGFTANGAKSELDLKRKIVFLRMNIERWGWW